MSIKLPGWLTATIVWAAGFLQGEAAQRSADAAAGQAKDASEDHVARQKQAEAEALDHDQLSKDETKWTAP